MISIILATKNGSKYIAAAIQSVLDQTVKDWEFIIVDDGSTDGVDKIIEPFLADPRFRLIKNPTNIGLAKSLNVGIQASRGEYIARIDDDDLWTDPHKLEKQLAYMRAHPDCVLLGTSFLAVDENGAPLYKITAPENDGPIRLIMLSRNPFGHSTIIARRDIVNKVGGYDDSLTKSYTEDWDLWLRMGLEGKWAILPDCTVTYMKRAGLSAQNTKQRQVKHHIRILKKFWRRYPLLASVWGIIRLTAYIILT